MLPKISRYLLVVLAIITLAYMLPAIYNTLFDTRINRPYVAYSELKKEYLISRWEGDKLSYTDRKNRTYTQNEFFQATPIANFYYHISKGTLPDSFAGIKLIPQVLQREMIVQYIDPARTLQVPEYGLYPLFESQPEFGLSLPDDVFRFNSRIEFIDAKTNKTNEAKSRKFTEQLSNEGFAFPAKVVGGLPSVMKRRDKGWFITDQRNQLFHLMMIKGEPFVKKIPLASGILIKHIICSDFESGEIFGFFITTNDQLYTINEKDYSTTKLPVEGYDPEQQQLLITGNLFNKTVVLSDEKQLKMITMDRQYNIIDQYQEFLPLKSEMSIGKAFSALFPFHLELESPNSSFIQLKAVASHTRWWLLLNVVLLAFNIVIIKREGRSVSKNIPDLLIIAGTGIFGFLAVNMAPYKQY